MEVPLKDQETAEVVKVVASVRWVFHYKIYQTYIIYPFARSRNTTLSSGSTATHGQSSRSCVNT